jgi:hypothetical protein
MAFCKNDQEEGTTQYLVAIFGFCVDYVQYDSSRISNIDLRAGKNTAASAAASQQVKTQRSRPSCRTG